MARFEQSKRSLVAVLSILGFWSAGAMAADPPAMSHDGLELVKESKVDVAYRRAGVDFAGYTRIMLDPFEVAFRKDWTRDFRTVSESEREQIRSELAAEAQKVFVEELQNKGGYQIVDRAAPDVLRVSAAIVELYINAPDAAQSGRSRTYVLSTGEATLVAELRDSVSGAVIARAADRARARETATMQWATRARNRADAQDMLARWAGALREALDEAHGKTK